MVVAVKPAPERYRDTAGARLLTVMSASPATSAPGPVIVVANWPFRGAFVCTVTTPTRRLVLPDICPFGKARAIETTIARLIQPKASRTINPVDGPRSWERT